MSAASTMPRPDRRLLYRTLAVAVFLCAIAFAIRYLLIELPSTVAICDGGGAPWWCGAREAIVQVFYNDIVGIMSLVLGLFALLLGGRSVATVLAVAAIISAAPSIVLYSTDYATPAFLLGLIRLLRG
jgi:hypothetical protein